MLTINEILMSTEGRLINGNIHDEIKDYKIDSRLIESDDFYIPIIGENVDGHKFIRDTVLKGSSGFFISNFDGIDIEEILHINKNVNIIQVMDTKQALIDIGKYNRHKHSNVEVVAITGSVGKTSTREMIASVLSQEKNLLVTQKNMNSHIGMPLMDLKIENQDIAILEAGIDFVGEMDILNDLLEPDIAVITNIGTSHIGKFGSQDIIYQEKTKIANSLKGKKILFLNKDDEYLKNYENKNVHIMYYSMDDAYNIKHSDVIEYDTIINGKMEHVKINAIGKHNILNSLVAIKIAQVYKYKTESILKGLENYHNFNRRMEKITFGDITLIDDTYNASPSSTESGLKSVNEMNSKRKIAVLADIAELGDYAKDLHLKIGKVFKDLNYDIIIAYGKDISYLVETAKEFVKEIYLLDDNEKAEEKIKEIMEPGDIIYFKGSNCMNVNKIVENIKKDFMN